MQMHANSLPDAILQTAAYADVFDFPLTSAEIHRYLIGIQASLAEVESCLRVEAVLSRTEGYFTLPGREMLVPVRLQRERCASRLWPLAVWHGRRIARLPFVRMVAVTGALAMNNVEQGADIDYLIVTEHGRLWLCRAMVVLLVHWAARQGTILCPNYLITLRNLDFPDQTLYAAHELAQMVPLAGLQVYGQIRAQNAWAARFLPNAQDHGARSSPAAAPSLARPALEALLRTPPFSSLEKWEMDRKIRKLRREQGASPEAHFSPDTCKGHAHRHQARTQAALGERLNSWQQEFLS